VKRIHLVLLVSLSAFLLAAPQWQPYVRQLHNHQLFVTVDSMFLLGVTLLAGILGMWLIRNPLLKGFEELYSDGYQVMRANAAIVGCIYLCALYLVNQKVLHSFMNSADEHSCYFLAETFRMGKWWVPPHSLSEFFDVVHVGNKAGKWFSVYPPGWPLLFAIGLQLQVQDWVNPMVSIAGLYFFYQAGKELQGRKSTGLAVLLVALTPFFAFTSASYFSHSTCFLCMSLFAWAFIHWTRSKDKKSRMRWAVIAGIAVGYGLMTRYLTMAAFAGPFLLYHAWPILRRKRKIAQSDLVFAAIVIAFMVLVFYQNFVISGKFYKPPNQFDKSWERLGFRDFYTPLDALTFVLARFFFLADWVPPAFLVFYLYLLFRKEKRQPLQELFFYSFLFPVIAYFFYFSWGGNQYGPRYYYEAFPWLMMAICHQTARGWRTISGDAKKFLVAGLLVSLGINGYFFYKHARYNEQVSLQRKALYVLAETDAQKPALVFIHGFLGDLLVMAEEDAVRNHPNLTGEVLYAHDRGKENKKLMDYYPDRKPYRGTYDRKVKQAVLKEL